MGLKILEKTDGSYIAISKKGIINIIDEKNSEQKKTSLE